ncbi:MAG TPA: histidine kinase [Flexivirga sp.]|uniref:sensor histidine kinase n=1 Tax=Flexivirga sp. TaxID=1962927 RepID=UPI002BCB84D0|nr:histidine kinase [Flexivirga sp.]HWC22541.1 histidine kinase [Flexivirga sp.]
MLNRLRQELEPSDDGRITGAWLDLFDERAQPFVTTALIVPSFLTLHPLGGRAWLSYTLMAASAILAYARLLPSAKVPVLPRFAISVAFCVCAGLVFGAAGWAVSMAFLACGHAGVIWPPKVAVGLTCLTVALALASNGLAAENPWVWFAVLAVGLSVFPGLATQNRRRTLRLSALLVEQTTLTAESDALASALAERTRIAREIHDVLAHSLSGVSLQLDLADAQLEAGRPDEGRATVRTARGLVVEGLDEARHAVRALREGTIDLGVTLRRMVQPGEELDFGANVGDPGSAAGQEIVRIVQEALTNARRHAHGAAVRVTVRRVDSDIVVDVVNARGREAAAGAGSGMGLVGIRERVELLGGSCSIGPVTDGEYAGGWRVLARVPAARSDAQDSGENTDAE